MTAFLHRTTSTHGRTSLHGAVFQRALVLITMLGAGTLSGQSLTYDRTVFVHGFNSDSSSWLAHNTLSSLANTMSLGINAPATPSLGGTSSLADQTSILETTLSALGGRVVIVGHSMGGLVARSVLHNDPSHIAAIITVGTPHEGTSLADSADKIIPFLSDVEYRLGDGLRAITFGKATQWVNSYFPNLQDFANQFALGTPALSDLRTTAPSLVALSQMYDAVPHANVYGSIPTEDALLRLGMSERNDDQLFGLAQLAEAAAGAAFYLCKVWGYATIVGSGTARRCSYARKAIGRVDDRWAAWANAGISGGFDGIVSNARTVYPGSSLSDPSLNFPAYMADHLNLIYDPAGIVQMTNAMLAIGMTPVHAAPTASISGPSSILPSATCTWSGSASGGTGPYSYEWENQGAEVATDASYTGGRSPGSPSPFTIQLTVTDAFGSVGRATINVTESSGARQCFQ